MNHQPFSVAISVYKNDNPVFFDRALESITDLQTIKPNEIVLVVDGPVPNEIDQVIDKYSSKYAFNIIRLAINGGLGNALKIATENAKYNLIARMDSDDVAISNRFEQQLQFLEYNPTVDIVGGDISEFVDNENNIVGKRIVPTSNRDLKRFLKKRCPFNHMTVMFKKASILNAGGYLDWHYNEDYYLWIRMFLNGAIFSNSGTVLVNVRAGNNQCSRRGGTNYLKSELKLQKFMLKSRVISLPRFLSNSLIRVVIEIAIPNKLRFFIYRHFLRKKA